MRYFKHLTLICIAAALMLTDCKKGSQQPSNNVSFAFKGQQYSISNPDAAYTGSSLAVSGKWGSSSVNLHVSGITAGTYDMRQQGTLTFATGSTVDDVYLCDSGTVTISSFNASGAEGSFTAMAVHPTDTTHMPVTGSFRVKF